MGSLPWATCDKIENIAPEAEWTQWTISHWNHLYHAIKHAQKRMDRLRKVDPAAYSIIARLPAGDVITLLNLLPGVPGRPAQKENSQRLVKLLEKRIQTTDEAPTFAARRILAAEGVRPAQLKNKADYLVKRWRGKN
jgi:hypothetical protein